MTITEVHNRFVFSFPFRKRIIDTIRNIPGRQFDRDTKQWSVPVSERRKVEHVARIFHFEILGPDGAPPVKLDIPEASPLPELTVDIPLKQNLFEYQKNGVAYCIQKKRTIIGDVPGLGKTAQAIATAVHSGIGPWLVICPASLRINWQREFEKWSDMKCQIMTDGIRSTWLNYYKVGFAQVFIVNYESLKKYFVEKIIIPEGKKLRLNHIYFKESVNAFKGVIIDESHKVKDANTQQAKFTKGICKGKEYVLALTGTPVINKPKDLISQLGIIDRIDEFGGYSHFMRHFCNNGVPPYHCNLTELNLLLRANCFYRREKHQVLKDLPAKMRNFQICEISNRAEYDKAERDFVQYLKDSGCSDEAIRKKMRGEIMVKIGALKMLSARGKIDAFIEFIDDIVDSGEKAIVFCHLKEIAEKLLAHFRNAVTIRGGQNSEDRQASVDRFQTDAKVNPIVCSIKAAGVGLTLTASSRVNFIEFPWTAADCDQCEDRSHRIGVRECVQVTYFLGRDTIDQWCYDLIQKKREISNAVTGAEDIVEEAIVDSITNLFLNRK